MRQCNLDATASRSISASTGAVDKMYLVGSGSPSDHSTSSHSSSRYVTRQLLRWAGRTRTAANRDGRAVLMPSRQVTGWEASEGKVMTRVFTETGA